jgi:hypothetical protein
MGYDPSMYSDAGYVTEDEVREGIRFLKEEFLRYKIPPVDLPADHVIERVVRTLLKSAKTNAPINPAAPRSG